ncbi:MAG: ATP-binding protein [Phycisphaerales bacterium JB052]
MMQRAPDETNPSDPSSEVRAELATTQALARASHLAELGAMAPLYAHEVNNLLTQLSARAQLAQMRPGQPELTEQTLQAVGDCCRRIEQLTQIFLVPDGSGDDRAQCERVSIGEIHRRVVAGVRADDRDRLGLKLLDQSMGYAPDAMPIMIEQVLSNLIINALRAIDEHPTPGDPHHRIMLESRAIQASACSTWNTAPGAHGIELIIEDTGIGMTPRQVSQLNSGQAIDLPSTRSPSSIKRHGLGLRVCRKLLSAAGGSMRCDSSINQGTRITVQLPAIKLDQDQARRAA